MEMSFRLNGKQVQAEVRPDMVLLDLVRELGCYSVKGAVRRQTAVCAPYGWTESRFFPAQSWPCGRRDAM